MTGSMKLLASLCKCCKCGWSMAKLAHSLFWLCTAGTMGNKSKHTSVHHSLKDWGISCCSEKQQSKCSNTRHNVFNTDHAVERVYSAWVLDNECDLVSNSTLSITWACSVGACTWDPHFFHNKHAASVLWVTSSEVYMCLCWEIVRNISL